ncbi:MAG: MFS transporter [Planctomycetota bacterium]
MPAPHKTRHDPSLRRAIRHNLCWAVMFGAGENSLGLFGAHLRIPKHVYGYLAGLPQLLGPLSQAVCANVLDAFPRRKPLIVNSVLLQALAYALLGVLAAVSAIWSSLELFLALVAFAFVAGHFCTPAWSSMIGDIIPPDKRGRLFSMLQWTSASVTQLSILAVAGALTLAGQGRAAGYVFAAAFGISAIARWRSARHIARMEDPPYVPEPETAFTFWQFLRRTPDSNYARFVLFVGLFHLAANVAGPFYLPYMFDVLALKPWHYAVMNSVTAISSILTFRFWGRFSDRFGNKRTIAISTWTILFIPIPWMLTDNFWILTLLNIFTGASWAGFSLSMGNYILDAVTPAKRARCVAYFNVVVGIGVFAGCMIGMWLTKHLPDEMVLGPWRLRLTSNFMILLALSTVLRLLTCMCLGTFKELRTVRPLTLRDRFFDIASVRSAFGVRLNMNVLHGQDEEDRDGD